MTELNGAITADFTQTVQVNTSTVVEVEQPINDQPLPRNRFNSFEEFQATIREMFISGSAIDPIMFDACVVFHQDQEYMDGGDVEAPIHDLLNWESFKRFSHQTSEKLYAAFLMNEDKTPWQAVLSIWDEDKQRPYKYLAPTNNGDRAFLPLIPPSIRKKIGSRYGLEVPEKGSFWEWLQDTDIPRVITEGGKKSLCGLSQGYAAISLYGCHCGAKTKNEEGEKVDAYVIDDIEQLATEGSRWLTALDRDDKHKTKLSTTRGKKLILKALKNYGCIVGDIEWKNSEGKAWMIL
jgi:putative DNA primase/helicase